MLQDVFYLIWDLPSILPILCLHHSQFQQRKLSSDEVLITDQQEDDETKVDLECESDGDDSVNPAIMKQYYTQYNATTSSVNTDIYYEDSF